MAEQVAQVLPFPPRYKIEKGIPLPPTRQGPKNYPFLDMAPGDSFYVLAKDAKTRAKVRSSIAGAACAFAKKHAPTTKYATRYVPGGIRCWRVK